MAEKKKLEGIPDEQQPREIIQAVTSAEELSKIPDATLLAVLLRTGIKGLNVVELADKLSHAYSSVADLWKYPTVGSFRQFLKDKGLAGKGIGNDKIVTLIAALELGKRATLQNSNPRIGPINKIKQAYDMVARAAKNFEEEKFWILLLDYRRVPIYSTPIMVSKGSATSTPVDPRVVYRIAIREGAETIIAIHNHLNENLSPSDDDLKLTQELIETGKTLNVKLLDHLIVSSTPFCQDCYSIVTNKRVNCAEESNPSNSTPPPQEASQCTEPATEYNCQDTSDWD